MALGIGFILFGLLVRWGARKVNARGVRGASGQGTRTGIVQGVEKVTGWAYGKPAKWYKVVVAMQDGERERLVLETVGSMWTPVDGALVHVLYDAAQPEKSTIAEAEVSDSRVITLVAYGCFVIGCVSIVASLF